MKISSENGSLVRGGMLCVCVCVCVCVFVCFLFFMRSSESDFFRSPGPLGSFPVSMQRYQTIGQNSDHFSVQKS